MKLVRHASLLALFACAAASQALIDQSQTSAAVYMTAFAQTGLAQSFRPSVGTISGAGILLFTSGDPASVTISLYTGLPSAGGVLLGSGSSGPALGGSWVDVSFGKDVSLVPESTYFLVLTSADNVGGVAGDTSDLYKRGETYANGGYQEYPNFDYTFRTFYNPSAAAAAVPGPIAALPFALMALRRRKAGK